MTNDENPADTVIKQAARAITAALADAGLLADPADRDEEGLQTRLDISVIAAKTFRARAERAEAERDHAREMAELAEKDRRTYHQDAIRAEAEVAELRATIDRGAGAGRRVGGRRLRRPRQPRGEISHDMGDSPAIATFLRYNGNAPAGAGNTPRGLTHSLELSKEGLAVNATHKTCVKCGETKPLSEFPPRGKCRECCRRKQAEYRAENRDHLLERKRKTYWRDVEETRRKANEYRHTNFATISAGEASWRMAHPEHNWKHHYIERAKRFDVPVVAETFSKDDVVARYGDRCFYCGIGDFEHLDHFEPVSKGGTHILANVRPSCAACNKSKHASPGEDFVRRNG